MSGMDRDRKNRDAQGLWWKRFLYTVTGANLDYEVGPNWFASVMGTGIIANAAAALPLFSSHLKGFALLVWCFASLMLVGLVLASVFFLVHRQNAWIRHFRDPMMAQFYGAPPMAALTVAGGALLVGQGLVGQELALRIAWSLWCIGTVGGLCSAVIIPYRLFTVFAVRPDSAFGGWLMPVVPPMVSAAIGAMLVPHAPVGGVRETLFYGCFSLFGLSLFAAVIIISMIWSRLAHHGTSGTSRVPTLWIVLGPLGQSMTAAGILGTVAQGAVPAKIALGFELFAVFYSVPVFGFVMLWTCLAILLTLRAHRKNMKFALTYWAFTFPVGTCVTGTAQLAHHTGLPLFAWASVCFFLGLILAWLVAAFGTTKGMITGHLFRPPAGPAGPIVSMKDSSAS
ncbi:TDT family transporter [Desulfobulbus rhabdoformis]|uniref:TDT family transporter n=1 Tax=Desulfobulbus rhabdoformis TaxID=34032 RepID=UPI001964AF29|nr:TDT family transporter [Desulfobulbus rhabdoformis]MBM9613221.1 TDT family transporter [Desulfobulbus rhabdoformis]